MGTSPISQINFQMINQNIQPLMKAMNKLHEVVYLPLIGVGLCLTCFELVSTWNKTRQAPTEKKVHELVLWSVSFGISLGCFSALRLQRINTTLFFLMSIGAHGLLKGVYSAWPQKEPNQPYLKRYGAIDLTAGYAQNQQVSPLNMGREAEVDAALNFLAPQAYTLSPQPAASILLRGESVETFYCAQAIAGALATGFYEQRKENSITKMPIPETLRHRGLIFLDLAHFAILAKSSGEQVTSEFENLLLDIKAAGDILFISNIEHLLSAPELIDLLNTTLKRKQLFLIGAIPSDVYQTVSAEEDFKPFLNFKQLEPKRLTTDQIIEQLSIRCKSNHEARYHVTYTLETLKDLALLASRLQPYSTLFEAVTLLNKMVVEVAKKLPAQRTAPLHSITSQEMRQCIATELNCDLEELDITLNELMEKEDEAVELDATSITAAQPPHQQTTISSASSQEKLPTKYTKDSPPPMVRLEEEMEMIFSTLGRRKPSLVLLKATESMQAVATDSMAYTLATGSYQIKQNSRAIPEHLKGKQLIPISPATLAKLQGAHPLQALETFFLKIEREGNILLIEELPDFISLVQTEHNPLINNSSFVYLLRDHIKNKKLLCIGTMAPTEVLEEDPMQGLFKSSGTISPALLPISKEISIRSFTAEKTLQILLRLKTTYEEQFKVTYTQEALEEIVHLATLCAPTDALEEAKELLESVSEKATELPSSSSSSSTSTIAAQQIAATDSPEKTQEPLESLSEKAEPPSFSSSSSTSTTTQQVASSDSLEKPPELLEHAKAKEDSSSSSSSSIPTITAQQIRQMQAEKFACTDQQLERAMKRAMMASDSMIVQCGGVDLTAEYTEDSPPPAIGRGKEIWQAINALSRSQYSAALFIGNSGAGKTTIVKGIAHALVVGYCEFEEDGQLVRKPIPKQLRGKRLIVIRPDTLAAKGAIFMGAPQKIFSSLLKEFQENGDILFMDEMHTLVGAGQTWRSPPPFINMLKTPVENGELLCIGATTLKEHEEYFIKGDHEAFLRRFAEIPILPFDQQKTLTILKELQPRNEQKYKVTYTQEALEEIVKIAVSCSSDTSGPLDEACKFLESLSLESKDSEITRSSVRQFKAKQLNCPEEKLDEKLAQLSQERQAREQPEEEWQEGSALGAQIGQAVTEGLVNAFLYLAPHLGGRAFTSPPSSTASTRKKKAWQGPASASDF